MNVKSQKPQTSPREQPREPPLLVPGNCTIHISKASFETVQDQLECHPPGWKVMWDTGLSPEVVGSKFKPSVSEVRISLLIYGSSLDIF